MSMFPTKSRLHPKSAPIPPKRRLGSPKWGMGAWACLLTTASALWGTVGWGKTPSRALLEGFPPMQTSEGKAETQAEATSRFLGRPPSLQRRCNRRRLWLSGPDSGSALHFRHHRPPRPEVPVTRRTTSRLRGREAPPPTHVTFRFASGPGPGHRGGGGDSP